MQDFPEHDYRADYGDALLSLIKKVFPDPEFRHHSLTWMARFGWAVPAAKPNKDIDLSHVVHFADGSRPLQMSNPVQLAAGSIKYGLAIPDYAHLGFGAVSVGTATRHEREGNPFRPRSALLEADRMMQNSMGLNNPGVDVLARRVESALVKSHTRGLTVGMSVAESPGIEDEVARVEDFLYSFRAAYGVADYLEINLSCPNTGHARIDAQWSFLDRLMDSLAEARLKEPLRKPVLAKLSPDMDQETLNRILSSLAERKFSGVVLFNTFPGAKSRFLQMQTKPEELAPMRGDGDLGGLSGRPLYLNTARAVQWVRSQYPDLAIFASGGVDHGAKAYDLMQAGADAVQVYSVLGFRWTPVWKILCELQERLRQEHFVSLQEMVQKSKRQAE
jgi:dihydroorotate dehydrogenase